MSDLWKDLNARGEQAINELCSSEIPETQTLEFKSKSDAGTASLSGDDKRNLGRSISGFSNAVGGIVIFGIAPVKSSEASAGSPAPIGPLAAFVDRVHGLVGQIITPPNPDIELLPITRADGSGYLAIRIGPSEMRPHMSLATEHQRYFLRSGSNTIPMVDFQIRDMLRIRVSPQLSLSVRFQKLMAMRSQGVATVDVGLVLTIVNEGRVSAREPYVAVDQKRRGAWEAAVPFKMRSTTSNRYFEASLLNLHPEMDADVAILKFQVQKSTNGEAVFSYKARDDARICVDTDLSLDCRIGCADVSATEVKLILPGQTFGDAMNSILVGERRVPVDPKHVALKNLAG